MTAHNRLAGALAQQQQQLADGLFTQGVVTAFTATTVSVTVAGAPAMTVPKISSYWPVIGDVVWLAGPPGSWLAVGALSVTPVFECVKTGDFAMAANTSFFANTGWTITEDTHNGGVYGVSQAAPMQYTIPATGRYDVEFRGLWGANAGVPTEIRVYVNGLDNSHWLCSDNTVLTANFFGGGNRARTTTPFNQNDDLYWWTGVGPGGSTLFASRGVLELTKVTVRYVGPV